MTFLLAALVGGTVSCHKAEREVTVTERREMTLFDQAYLDDVKDYPPMGWRRIPFTPFRICNYRFGEDDSGEVWLSVVQMREGSEEAAVVQNVNRWFGQFGLPPVTSLEGLETAEMLGTTGYVVEAEGSYVAGMGAQPEPGKAMLAAAIPAGETFVTVKMIGTPAQVREQREAFMNYCKTLVFHDVLSIPETEES